MKKLQKLLLGLFAASALIFSSCGDPVEGEAPTISLGTGTGFTYADSELEPLDTFEVQVIGSIGSEKLETLKIERGLGTPSASFVLSIGSSSETYDDDVFPVELSGDDKDGFTIKIQFVAPQAEGTNNYTFTVVDKEGEEASTSITITTAEPTTALSVVSGDFKLFSKLGPAGYGGLELSDGSSTGSADGDLADITASAWDGGFEGANGTSVVSVAASYYAAAVEEDIASTYSAGSSYDGSAPSVNDVFIAYDGSTYFVLQVTATDGNDTDVSATNGQYIQFAVKSHTPAAQVAVAVAQ